MECHECGQPKEAQHFPPGYRISFGDNLEADEVADFGGPSIASKIPASKVLEKLQDGNERYVINSAPVLSRWQPDYLPQKDKPAKAIVLCGAHEEVRHPEYLFNAEPGDLLVHRTCGAISGRPEGCALSTLEMLVRQHPEVS